jgi:hypothetical protein
MANIIKAGSTVAGYTTTPDQSGVLEIRTGQLAGGTTAMTIDGSQNVTMAGNLNVLGAVTGGVNGVRQVIQSVRTTEEAFTSTSYVSSNIQARITPSSSTSKVLVMLNIGAAYVNQGAATPARFALYRTIGTGTVTSIVSPWVYSASVGGVNNFVISSPSSMYLDSPNTTSEIIYTVYVLVGVNYAPVTLQYSSVPSYLTLAEYKP